MYCVNKRFAYNRNMRTPTTIRFSKEEREEIAKIMKQYGYTELAPFLRFAIQKLINTDHFVE